MNALQELQRLTYEEFAREHVLVGSAERDFQVAIQAALDVGAYLLAELSVQTPMDYKDIFPKLAEFVDQQDLGLGQRPYRRRHLGSSPHALGTPQAVVPVWRNPLRHHLCPSVPRPAF